MAADAQPGAASIACVDPKATFVLGDPDMMLRHTARWRASVGRRGRCFTIEAGEHWERVITTGGLVLMRKVPPEPGVPPLYFRADRLVGGAQFQAGGDGTAGLDARAAGVSGFASHPAPRGFGRPGQVAARAGRAVTEILTDTLPPLPTAELPDPASTASKQPVLGQSAGVDPVPFGPIVVAPVPAEKTEGPAVLRPVSEEPLAAIAPSPAAMKAPAAQQSPVPVIPDSTTPPSAALPVPRPPRQNPYDADLSVASARGYVFGFAITITLLVLLLAALVLVLRMLLRPSPALGPALGPAFGEDRTLNDQGRGDPGLPDPGSGPGALFARPPVVVSDGSGRSKPSSRASGSRHPVAAGPVVAGPVVAGPVVAGPFVGAVRTKPVVQEARMGLADPTLALAPPLAVASLSKPERCAARLREAGWAAVVRAGSGRRLADVVARRDGRVMALRCYAADGPVEEDDVEAACFAREHERADLAVIVSSSVFTAGARQLALRTGVELLPDEGFLTFLAG